MTQWKIEYKIIHVVGVDDHVHRGITLIALIITIIVMLILVGVTINLSANGGLFNKTREGSKETEKWAIYDQIVSATHLTNDGKISIKETFESFKKNFGENKVEKDEEKSSNSKIVFTVQGNRGTYTYTITEEKIIVGTDKNDDKFLQPQITLNVGAEIPMGYYYLTNINEDNYTADLYAVNAEEYNKFPAEFGDYEYFEINYKGSTIPKACLLYGDDVHLSDYFMDINNKLGYSLERDEDEQENWGWRIYTYINANDISTTPISNLFVIIGNYNLVRLDESFNSSENMVDASKMQLPNTVTSMVCCFSHCKNLELAPTLLPNLVEDMSCCFSNCSKLTSAPDLPTSITDIERCFDGCSNLNEVNYLGTLEQFKQINGYDKCGNNGFVVHCTDGDYTSEWNGEE